jgi:hypothetical protein
MIRFKILCVLLAAGGTAMAQIPSNEAPKYPPGLYAMITTSVGVITAELFEKETPRTVGAFVGWTRKLGSRPRIPCTRI